MRWVRWYRIHSVGRERRLARTKWHLMETGEETKCKRKIEGRGMMVRLEEPKEFWETCRWCRKKERASSKDSPRTA